MLERVLKFVNRAIEKVKRVSSKPDTQELQEQIDRLNTLMKGLLDNFTMLDDSSKPDYTKYHLLKEEIRYHELAKAFINGIPYRKIEGYLTTAPSINKLFPIVLAYRAKATENDKELYEEVFEWLSGDFYE